MGHYGPDDTFLMWAIEKINKNGENINQFKLKNYIVCENYTYRNRKHYDLILQRIDRKEEFKQNAYKSFEEAINNIK
jgi:hypothetical protein